MEVTVFEVWGEARGDESRPPPRLHPRRRIGQVKERARREWEHAANERAPMRKRSVESVTARPEKKNAKRREVIGARAARSGERE